MSDQAYAGIGDRTSANSEWNRLDFAIRSVLRGVQTATIVQVTAVRAGLVDVQPLVNQLDGAGNAIPHGTIHNLPVWRLQGGTGGVIVDPVVGDRGLAVFAHNDTSSVKANRAASNPGSLRRHDWADGIYLGGLLNADPTCSLQFAADGSVTLTATGPLTLTTQGEVMLSASTVAVSMALTVGNGASGTFKSQDGKVVTVTSGIVTSIV